MATSLTLQNDASLAQGYVKVNGTTSATFTTTGISTPAATIGSITGMLKASSGVVSQAVAGTDYLTSTSGGTITLATAQTASGTAVDFTGIPSWVKRITVMLSGVSTSGTSNILIQLGDSGGIETTSYIAGADNSGGSGITTATTGFILTQQNAALLLEYGITTICLFGSNTWVYSSSLYSTIPRIMMANGNKTLSDTLTQIRITTVNGTDTFDAGTINISYE